jgi:hypothetical protein
VLLVFASTIFPDTRIPSSSARADKNALFIIVFLIVLALMGASAWAVQWLSARRLSPANRSRRPRLAVIEAVRVDARHRLILIRRDNVEHLLMTGEPTDLVIESNIVPIVAAARQASGARALVPDRRAVVPAEITLQPDSMQVRTARSVETKTESVVSVTRGYSEAESQSQKPSYTESNAGRREPKSRKGLYDSFEQEMTSLLGSAAAPR